MYEYYLVRQGGGSALRLSLWDSTAIERSVIGLFMEGLCALFITWSSCAAVQDNSKCYARNFGPIEHVD